MVEGTKKNKKQIKKKYKPHMSNRPTMPSVKSIHSCVFFDVED